MLPPEIAQFSPVCALLSQLPVLPHSPWDLRSGRPVVSTSADNRWGTWPAPSSQNSGHHTGQTLLPISPLHHWQCLLLTAHNISRHWGLCPNPAMPPAAFRIRHYSCRPCAFCSPWVYFFLLDIEETCLGNRLAGKAAAYGKLRSALRGRKADLGCFVLFWTLLSWHRKELRKSRRKVTETPEKPSLEVYGNFSSTTGWNYKPRDKTRQKQRLALENG